MLLQNLQKNIDDKWDDCWPISSLRPLAVLDLISYIYFIKKLDDRELIHKKLQSIQGSNFLYAKEVEEFTWSRLKNMDVQQIHDLFTKEHGVIDVMTQYASSNSLYSDFFKAPLVLTPTPKLLSRAIEIINLIESSDIEIQAAILDYLLNKAEISGQNGQILIPPNIAWLMVAIAEPTAKDITCDPAAGTGSLIIHTARYIANRNNSPVSRLENSNPTGMLKGMESDLIQLRLAAMNMILHGINNPDVEILDIFRESAVKLPGKPTLIISNLFVTEADGNMTVEGDTLKFNKPVKEIELLKLILDNLEEGGRAVVLLPEYILNNSSPGIKKIRQDIITNCALQGVICLPSKSNSLFPGAGILIFSKQASANTDTVWFYKMKKGFEGSRREESLLTGTQDDFLPAAELYEANEILNQWKNRKSAELVNHENTFFTTVYDIKDNDYNLNFNDYKIIQRGHELTKKLENDTDQKNLFVTTKKEHLHHFFEESVPVPKKKPRRRIISVIILLLFLISAGAGAYIFYGKNIVSFFANINKRSDTVSHSNNVVEPKAETAGNIPADNKKDVPGALKNNTLAVRHGVSKGYTVTNRTYFYSAPDTTKRKNIYLQPIKGLVLNPTDEQKGFVYVVYVNKKGKTTKGWLNKNELQPTD